MFLEVPATDFRPTGTFLLNSLKYAVERFVGGELEGLSSALGTLTAQEGRAALADDSVAAGSDVGVSKDAETDNAAIVFFVEVNQSMSLRLGRVG